MTGARVTACRYLACQHVWDPHAPDGPTSHYQTRWWARIELDPWLELTRFRGHVLLCG
jgi:hypothetical protein